MTLKVTSEIGKLKSVLVHLPGPEIDRMVPSMMEELLFDDILYGDRAREEHRRFQQVLGYVADEVLEVQDLLEEVLQVPEQRGAVLDDLARTLGWAPDMEARLRDLPAEQLASALVAGIEKPTPDIASAAADFYELPPIPNYFFQRDPLVVVGDRAIRGSMATSARAARAAPVRLRALPPPALRQPGRREVLVPGVLGGLRQARRPTRACGRRSRAATSSFSGRTSSRSGTPSGPRRPRSSASPSRSRS